MPVDSSTPCGLLSLRKSKPPKFTIKAATSASRPQDQVHPAEERQLDELHVELAAGLALLDELRQPGEGQDRAVGVNRRHRTGVAGEPRRASWKPHFLRDWGHHEVRMVFEHEGDHASQWAAISSIAAKIGCNAETLRGWVRRVERDQGKRPGPTTDEQERIKALERENRELRQANEILCKGSAYSAQAEFDRPFKKRSPSSTRIAPSTGASRSARCCRSPRRPTAPMRPGGPTGQGAGPFAKRRGAEAGYPMGLG